MATAPEQDLVTYIDINSVSFTAGTNLFYSQMREVSEGVPHQCAFIFPVGGTVEVFLEGCNYKIRSSDLQIRMRGNPDDHAGSLVLARELRDTADLAEISGYRDIRVLDAEPINLQQDETGRWHWDLTVTMEHEVPK